MDIQKFNVKHCFLDKFLKTSIKISILIRFVYPHSNCENYKKFDRSNDCNFYVDIKILIFFLFEIVFDKFQIFMLFLNMLA